MVCGSDAQGDGRGMVWSLLAVLAWCAAFAPPTQGQQRPAPRNVVLILSDDHRYDFLGYMPAAPDWLQTPSLDRDGPGRRPRPERVRHHLALLPQPCLHPHRTVRPPARGGGQCLTGAAGHRLLPPQRLRKAGYRTAYIGKWHMGEAEADDTPRPGFDHWISFPGQGVYDDPVLNVNGVRGRAKGYTTDVLTDSALAWLERRDSARPFFLYLSHKATHAEFIPPERYRGRYAGAKIPYPPTMANTEGNSRGKPRWVREQRYGWHGVDYAYHGQMDFDTFYRRYAETLLALDEGVGRVLDYLMRSGLSKSTLVLYMSDNGFSLGEHGLIDKRHAYEESIRIPMLAWAPGYIPAGSTVRQLVRNIDVAPTILELAGADRPADMDGRSVLGSLRGERADESAELLYEYYWEYAFPHTPTVFALGGPRYKYIYYHGVWGLNELYDLETDSMEQHNLIEVPALQQRIRDMRDRLFDRLKAGSGMRIPLRRGDWQAAERKSHE